MEHNRTEHWMGDRLGVTGSDLGFGTVKVALGNHFHAP